MAYSRTTWENSPSTATPISAALLNNMEQGIVDVDGSISSISGSVTSIAGSVNNTAGSVVVLAGTAGTAYNLTSTYGSVSSHVSATTSVHGITDTANLVYTNNATLGSVATINASLGSVAGTVSTNTTAITNLQGTVSSIIPSGNYSYLPSPRITSLYNVWKVGKIKNLTSPNSFYSLIYSYGAVGAYLGYTSNGGTSYSFPGGTTSSPFWGGSSTNLTNNDIISLDASSDGSVVYLAANTDPGTTPYAIYKSTNSGTTFTTVGATSVRYVGLTCSSNGSVIYATTQNTLGTVSLSYSNDGGATWGTPAALASASGLGVSPLTGANGSVAYVSVGGTSLYRTLDAGTTWSVITLPVSGLEISTPSISANGSVVLINGIRTTTLYASYLYLSTDQGNTWNAISPLDEWSFSRISPNGNIIIAKGAKAAYVSKNQGASWKTETILEYYGAFPVNNVANAQEVRFSLDSSFAYSSNGKYTF